MTFSPGVLSAAADRLVAPPDQTWSNPAAWGRQNFRGWMPAAYQEDIAVRLATHRKVSVIGPHGMGKTGLDALLVNWFARTRDAAGVDWKVVTTAGAWRQLQRYLWPEINKWTKRLAVPYRKDELLTQEIKLRYGQAFPVASDEPANIEGAHADEILYIIDEAKNVPPGSWDAIEGALSAGNAYVIANSTPGKAEGRLYDIHRHAPGFEDWDAIHVTLDMAIEAGRIKPEWAEARRRQWGPNSPVFKNRVLGEFSTYDEDGVIPLEWLELANERWVEKYGSVDDAESERDAAATGKKKMWRAPGPLTAVAADVASEHGVDKTIIAKRYGLTIAPLIVLPQVDTMKTTGEVMKAIHAAVPPKSKRDKPLAVIDAIGVGTGVVDRLRELEITVDAFQAAGKALKSDETGELHFLNRRAEAWWRLKDLLNPAFGYEVALPDDPELIGDLTSPKQDTTSTGLIKIEEKDDIIARLGRSPDKGDAVVMALAARLVKVNNYGDMMPIALGGASRWKAS